MLANSVERVCGGTGIRTYHQSEVNFDFGDTVEMRQLARCCTELRRLAPTYIGENKASALSHSRINCLVSQVMLLAGSKMRLPMPRYYFQALQATSVKLSVSPQPRVLGEPVSVPQGSQLALKVEGVLRHGRRASLYRSVAAVCISISTTPPSKINSDQKVNANNFIREIIFPLLHKRFTYRILIPTNYNKPSRHTVTSLPVNFYFHWEAREQTQLRVQVTPQV